MYIVFTTKRLRKEAENAQQRQRQLYFDETQREISKTEREDSGRRRTEETNVLRDGCGFREIFNAGQNRTS